jgi:signal transduction histidine kinase
VEVRDSGAGVDPVEINKLFEPFFTTKSKGLGMGLAISRSIIEGHDGNLTMSSGLGAGTAVRITLPSR